VTPLFFTFWWSEVRVIFGLSNVVVRPKRTPIFSPRHKNFLILTPDFPLLSFRFFVKFFACEKYEKIAKTGVFTLVPKIQ
jgi:hypothetical protein